MINIESVHLNRKNKQIFSGLTLSVEKDEKVLIQGKSGVGKTTLFKILLGFETIDKGNITFNGLDLAPDHIKTIREQTFYLSQDIDLKNEVIDQLIDEILEANAIEKPSDSQLAEHLDFLELNEKLLLQKIKELSGGERQRIGLLICFLLNRPVWLLDEPTSALDDTMKEKIVGHILAQEKTIIIVSHDAVWKQNNSIRIERWV
jgi:UDP-glucose/iron transport system ATP-binding protein